VLDSGEHQNWPSTSIEGGLDERLSSVRNLQHRPGYHKGSYSGKINFNCFAHIAYACRKMANLIS
jgi:hypothetical protein